MVGAGPSRMEPCDGVAAGKNVLLDAKCRDEEAMDHVLRSHNDLDVAAGGNMQRVNLTHAFGMLKLPHPLLGNGINLHCVTGRRSLPEVEDRAPCKEDQEKDHGEDRPGKFQGIGAFDLMGMVAGALAIFDGENDDGQRNENCHRSAHHQQEDVELVYIARHGRSSLRPQWKVVPHSYATRSVSECFATVSRRNITNMNVPMISTVTPPAIRN